MANFELFSATDINSWKVCGEPNFFFVRLNVTGISLGGLTSIFPFLFIQKMAESVICCVCDRVIKANQNGLEYSRCGPWVPKGCSGLSTAEFSKICTLPHHSGSHSWECEHCADSEVRRVSLGNVSDSRSGRQQTSKRKVLASKAAFDTSISNNYLHTFAG